MKKSLTFLPMNKDSDLNDDSTKYVKNKRYQKSLNLLQKPKWENESQLNNSSCRS